MSAELVPVPPYDPASVLLVDTPAIASVVPIASVEIYPVVSNIIPKPLAMQPVVGGLGRMGGSGWAGLHVCVCGEGGEMLLPTSPVLHVYMHQP